MEVAAKVTEESVLVISIMIDGIGLVLMPDYLEAIHKILPMINV